MKTLVSALDGAVTVTEDQGVFTLKVSKAAALGGGEAAGIAKVSGDAEVILDAATGVKLGEALLNAHIPTSLQALVQVVEGVANQALAGLE